MYGSMEKKGRRGGGVGRRGGGGRQGRDKGWGFLGKGGGKRGHGR